MFHQGELQERVPQERPAEESFSPRTASQQWSVEKSLVRVPGGQVGILEAKTAQDGGRIFRHLEFEMEASRHPWHLSETVTPYRDHDKPMLLWQGTSRTENATGQQSETLNASAPLALSPQGELTGLLRQIPMGNEAIKMVLGQLHRFSVGTQPERMAPAIGEERRDSAALSELRERWTRDLQTEAAMSRALISGSTSPALAVRPEVAASAARERQKAPPGEEKYITTGVRDPAAISRAVEGVASHEEGGGENSGKGQSIFETLGRAKQTEAEAYRAVGEAVGEAARDLADTASDIYTRGREIVDSASEVYHRGEELRARLSDPAVFGNRSGASAAENELRSQARHQTYNAHMVREWTEFYVNSGMSRESAEKAAVATLGGAGIAVEVGTLVWRTGESMIDDLFSGAPLVLTLEGMADVRDNLTGIRYGLDPNFNVADFEAASRMRIDYQRSIDAMTERFSKMIEGGLQSGYKEKTYSLGVDNPFGSSPSSGGYGLGLDYTFGSSSNSGSDIKGGEATPEKGSSDETNTPSGEDDNSSDRHDVDTGLRGPAGDPSAGTNGTASSGGSDSNSSGSNTTDDGSSSGSEGGSEEGGCFLTTACLNALAIGEAETILDELRVFRDTTLRTMANGPALIEEYYRIAPEIVRSINNRPEFRETYREIFDAMVVPTVTFIRQGLGVEAVNWYREKVFALSKDLESTSKPGA